MQVYKLQGMFKPNRSCFPSRKKHRTSEAKFVLHFSIFNSSSVIVIEDLNWNIKISHKFIRMWTPIFSILSCHIKETGFHWHKRFLKEFDGRKDNFRLKIFSMKRRFGSVAFVLPWCSGQAPSLVIVVLKDFILVNSSVKIARECRIAREEYNKVVDLLGSLMASHRRFRSPLSRQNCGPCKYLNFLRKSRSYRTYMAQTEQNPRTNFQPT